MSQVNFGKIDRADKLIDKICDSIKRDLRFDTVNIPSDKTNSTENVDLNQMFDVSRN